VLVNIFVNSYFFHFELTEHCRSKFAVSLHKPLLARAAAYSIGKMDISNLLVSKAGVEEELQGEKADLVFALMNTTFVAKYGEPLEVLVVEGEKFLIGAQIAKLLGRATFNLYRSLKRGGITMTRTRLNEKNVQSSQHKYSYSATLLPYKPVLEFLIARHDRARKSTPCTMCFKMESLTQAPATSQKAAPNPYFIPNFISYTSTANNQKPAKFEMPYSNFVPSAYAMESEASIRRSPSPPAYSAHSPYHASLSPNCDISPAASNGRSSLAASPPRRLPKVATSPSTSPIPFVVSSSPCTSPVPASILQVETTPAPALYLHPVQLVEHRSGSPFQRTSRVSPYPMRYRHGRESPYPMPYGRQNSSFSY